MRRRSQRAMLAIPTSSKYMNPYTQSVINSSLPIMQQELGKTLATNAGTAAATACVRRLAIRRPARHGAGAGRARHGEHGGGPEQRRTSLRRRRRRRATSIASFTARQSNQAAQQAKINSDIQAASGLNTTGGSMMDQANKPTPCRTRRARSKWARLRATSTRRWRSSRKPGAIPASNWAFYNRRSG